MTPAAAISTAMAWLRTAVALLILLSITVILAKAFGFVIPLRTPGHIELAYLAGAYWLVR